MSRLRLVSLVSGIYDVVLGLAFLTAAAKAREPFGVPPPVPAVLGDTNGLFLLAVGAGLLAAAGGIRCAGGATCG